MQSKKILKTQDGEDKGEYKLTDLHLEYEIIESENLVREVKGQYNVGRSLGYDHTTLLKTLSWKKHSTREVIDVNIPRKSMKAIVLLFTKSDAGESENFPFAGVTKVNVTVEGNPNDVYSEGLPKRGMYDEQEGSSVPCTSLAENFTRTNLPASWTSETSTMRASVEAGKD